MKKSLYFTNYQTLQNGLKDMRLEIRQQEIDLKVDAKSYISNLPKKILTRRIKEPKHYIIQSNPIGKLLATTVTNTVLKKEGFIIKLIAKILLRKVGKKVTRKLIHA